ncbi:putative cytochrome p450 [Diplodia seriata]|uniref:Putative cytochrome p450 n=1 Tax=Diplodia seriata TaxID=420778 RepID=A0A0G2F070_9PEZI|nr:putative cytochrome p450 [Diplodia seriata]
MAETTSPVFAYGAAALLGVISHVAYFNRSEHHLHAIRYMQLFALTYLATVFLLARTAESSSSPSPTAAAAAFRTATSLASSYLAGLYTSLLTYRLTPLHPLSAFPGPPLARLTSFYLPFHVLYHPPAPAAKPAPRRIPQAYRTLAALHAHHGPIVRVGTNELSIADPAGVPLIYGPASRYCSDQLDERMKTKPADPDIMSSLIEPVKDKELSDRELKMLQADSRLIIVAGSDTTSSTLTHIFYHLAASPHHQAKLLAELRPHMIIPSSSSPDADPTFPPRALQDLPHLNALISETLRLHPPVPSALQRLTPATGLTLPSGVFIPPATVVWCPAHVIGRSAAAYVEPEAFVPERWYDESKKGWVKEEKAFAPFSMGAPMK